jgi:hypothetical protein
LGGILILPTLRGGVVMVKWSRVIITTVFGLVFGIMCMFGSNWFGVPFWPLGISYLLHHTVMGFTIGVSGWRLHWAVHGTVWGALFGLFLSIGCIGGPLSPLMAFFMPVIYGFLIETIATKGFKQPQ